VAVSLRRDEPCWVHVNEDILVDPQNNSSMLCENPGRLWQYNLHSTRLISTERDGYRKTDHDNNWWNVARSTGLSYGPGAEASCGLLQGMEPVGFEPTTSRVTAL